MNPDLSLKSENKFAGEPRFVRVAEDDIEEFATKIAEDFEKTDAVLGIASVDRAHMVHIIATSLRKQMNFKD